MRQIGRIKIGHFVKDENGKTWQVNAHYTESRGNKMTTLLEVTDKPKKCLDFKPSTTQMEYLGDLCFVNGHGFVPHKRDPFESLYRK